ISLAVAARVFQINDVRRIDNQHAAGPAKNGRRPGQAVLENRALVVLAVAVSVLQHSNAANVLVFVLRITPHFCHIEASVFIKCHCHWVSDERLSGDLLDTEPGGDMKLFQGIGRLGWRNSRQLARIIAVERVFRGLSRKSWKYQEPGKSKQTDKSQAERHEKHENLQITLSVMWS